MERERADDARVLVLGGSGMLGRALCRQLAACGLRAEAPPRSQLDLEDCANLARALDLRKSTAVFNAAAFTDVAGAEAPAARATVYRINRDAPGALAAACAARSIPFVHVSTDYVFDGASEQPYREEDPPSPLQHYGRSKLAGERAVARAHPGALIVRTSTLYGPGRRPRPHYVDAIRAQAAHRDRLEVVRLPVSSPTCSLDLAAGLVELWRAGATGIVHGVNSGGCSRLELARAVVALAYPERAIEVVERPAPSDTVSRPDYSVLAVEKWTEICGAPPRRWDQALQDYLRIA